MTHLPSSDYPCARCGVFCRQQCKISELAIWEIKNSLWNVFGDRIFIDNYQLDHIFHLRDLVTGILKKYHLSEKGWA